MFNNKKSGEDNSSMSTEKNTIIRDCRLKYFDKFEYTYQTEVDLTNVHNFKYFLKSYEVLNKDSDISYEELSVYMNKLIAGCIINAPKHFNATIEVI